jgi:PilZ domain-containing protein
MRDKQHKKQSPMLSEKRRDKRQTLTCPSFVVSENGVRTDCQFEDISARGARIHVENSQTIPDNFMLVLSERSKLIRLCTVIWRGEKQVGVTFRPAA